MIPAGQLEALERLSHPAEWGKRVGRIPYSSQLIVLLCPHRNKETECGRGVGKSLVLIGDNEGRRAFTLPYLRAAVTKCSKPIPYRGIMIGAVKDHAFELQQRIYDLFHSEDWLASAIDPETTKTRIRLKNRALITVKAATAAARGPHAETMLGKRGMVKGIISVDVDEAWFITEESFFAQVIRPMQQMAGPGSQFLFASTPYGKQGPMWDIHSSGQTGECMQLYTLDPKTRRRIYHFDREICRTCMAKYHTVRFNFPSWENPYVNLRALLNERRDLMERGQIGVWEQEYLGIPSETVAMFFNEHHQKMKTGMWDDDLEEYRLLENGDFVRRSLSTGGETDEEVIDPGNAPRGEFYLGIDPNRGVESRRVDYASLGLVQICRDGKVPLRLCQRFKKAPPYFWGKSYQLHEITPFMIDYASFLIETFEVRKVYLDMGGGGEAYYWPLVQRFGEDRVEYIKTSLQDKMRALLHLRMLIERGLGKAPPIDWLVRETRHLRVDVDSLDEDKVRVSKVAAWGTAGAEVDGVFAWAYACRGAEVAPPQVDLTVSQRELPLERDIGGRRPVPIIRKLSGVV